VRVMTGKEEGAATEEVFPKLTRDVIDRMSSAKSGRLQEVMEIVIRHLQRSATGSSEGELSYRYGRYLSIPKHHACQLSNSR
jgi:hypothetical protein